jgi:hypothetical protein
VLTVKKSIKKVIERLLFKAIKNGEQTGYAKKWNKKEKSGIYLWRLYPEIHNQALLSSARVKAKIRTATTADLWNRPMLNALLHDKSSVSSGYPPG